MGMDFIATGHYVRLRRETQNHKLLKGKDKEKDQSYFLWQLSQKQLKYTLFPVGGYTKNEVRKLAKKFKLPVFEAPESMEICFIQNTINDFLARYLEQKRGKIVNKEGKIIGRHNGLWFYTIGQRKGIGLAGGPYYVLDKNMKRNALIITRNENDLYKKELVVKDINWISGREPRLPIKIKAKIRYRHNPASATLTLNSKLKTHSLKFDKPQRAITPGQSAVFYKGQELLGGGIIC
jgi:tRNA-specific 2-thiouridylase